MTNQEREWYFDELREIGRENTKKEFKTFAKDLRWTVLASSLAITGIHYGVTADNNHQELLKDDFYANTGLAAPSHEITILQLTGEIGQPQAKDIFRVITTGNTSLDRENEQLTAEQAIEAGLAKEVNLPKGQELVRIPETRNVEELPDQYENSNNIQLVRDYEVLPEVSS
jgi:hypothetical protein